MRPSLFALLTSQALRVLMVFGLHAGRLLLAADAEQLPKIDLTNRDLGKASMERGNYELAVTYFRHELESARKVMNEGDLGVVIRRAELGEACRAAGQWPDAVKELNYAWQRFRSEAEGKGQWLGEEGNLAVEYGEKLGRAYLGASRFLDAARTFAFMISDGQKSKRDETELLQPSAMLADTLLVLKRDSDADECVQLAVQIAERRHANNTAVQSTVFSGLADIYVQHGMYSKAKPLAERALDLTTERSNADPTFLATQQAALGAILTKLGETTDALEMLQAAQAAFSQTMTKDSEKFILIERCYSEIALQKDQRQTAGTHAVEALRICKLHYSDDDPEFAKCLAQLAEVYEASDRPNEARETYTLALSIVKAALGNNHPLTLEYQGHLKGKAARPKKNSK